MKFPKLTVLAALILALSASAAMAGNDHGKKDDHKGRHDHGRNHVNTVPEPGSLALVLLAGSAAFVLRRRPKAISKI